MKKLLLCLLIGLSPAWVKAQEKVKLYGGFGHFNVGVLHQDLGEVNKRFTAHGYPALEKTSVTTGGAGYGVINRIMIGGEGTSTITQESSHENLNLEVQAERGQLQVGYVAIAKKNWLAYPLLGFGGSTTTISINPQQGAQFDDVLQQPARSTTLTYNQTIFSASLGAMYFTKASENFLGGLALGLQAGALFRPGSGEWEADGETVSEGPTPARATYFLQLSIGGGGIYKSNN